MIYLLAMSFPMKILGAVITVKDDVLYNFYAAAPRVWGLTPGGDQRLGGLMMWLPAGLVLWFLAARAFTLWWKQDRRDRQTATTSTAVMVALLALGGCSQSSTDNRIVEKPVQPGLVIPMQDGKITARLLIPEPVDMTKMFVLPVRLDDQSGRPIGRAQVVVNATMPEHGHGMMTEPKPSTQMECDTKGMCLAKKGRFLMDGFRLHMSGSWLFSVKVTTDKTTTSGEARYEF